MHPREGAHLDRLQDHDRKASLLQMPDHPPFIASRRFDSHALDPSLGQFRTQTLPTPRGVLDAPMRSLTVNCDIELVLGRINAGHRHASLRHLRRSLPCEANQIVPATIRAR